jgi:hypothetical protein
VDKARLRGQIGAYSLHAKYGGKEITEHARRGFMAKFEREVDPLGQLPVEERRRRAASARRAYMLKLALKSAKARAAKRGS